MTATRALQAARTDRRTDKQTNGRAGEQGALVGRNPLNEHSSPLACLPQAGNDVGRVLFKSGGRRERQVGPFEISARN